MLSDTAKKYLSSLVYNRDAEIVCSIIPMGGIYWADEIPDFRKLRQMPEEARGDIYRLFRIRYALWDGVELSPEDLKFLELARLIVPGCPIFKRLVPADHDLQIQKDIREEMNDIYRIAEEYSGSSEKKLNKDGSVTTTWQLKKK
jgi:hypothetical protein